MDLAVLEADHHDHRDRYPATGGIDRGQHDVEHAIVGEGDVQFVDDLVLAHRSRDGLDLGVVGPLADEVVAVEVAHAGRAIATGDRWYVMDVGVVGHRRHRRLEVEVLELRLHVRVESRRQVAHSHSSNPPLRAVSLILSPSGGGRLVYRDTGTELVLNALAAGPGRLERVRCGVRAKRKQPNRAPRNALASLRPALRGSWPPEAGRLDLSRLLPSREAVAQMHRIRAAGHRTGRDLKTAGPFGPRS